MKKIYHSPFLAMNANHRSRHVTADSVSSNAPAATDGSKCVQMSAGTKTLVSDVYSVKSNKSV